MADASFTPAPVSNITLPASSPVLNSSAYNAAPVRSAPSARVNPDTIGSTPSPAPATPGAPGTPAPYVIQPIDPETMKYSDASRTNANNSTRLDQISQYAQSITDSINAKYGSKVSNDSAVIAGQDARARVLNTRTGNTDSGTGSAAIGVVQDKGAKVLAADEAARNAEIGVALGKVDALKADQAKAFAAQQANDLKSYNDLKAKNAKSATDSIASLGKSGVDAETLRTKEPETYAAIQKETGKSDLEMTAAFNASRPTPTKFQYKISGDEVTAYGVDSNGKLVTQTQTIPGLSKGNFEIHELKDGTILKLNKDTGEYSTLRNSTQSAGPQASKADVSGAITWMRAQADYKPEYEKAFSSDPVIQAKVIAAWKAATKSKSGSSSSASNPYASNP